MSEEGIAKAASEVGISHIDEIRCDQRELLHLLSGNVHNPCGFIGMCQPSSSLRYNSCNALLLQYIEKDIA
jgi:hypothetical protein